MVKETDIADKKSEQIASEKSGRMPWNPFVGLVAVIVIFFAAQLLGGLLVSIYPSSQGWSSDRINDWLSNSIAAQFVYIVIAEGLTLGALALFLRHYKSSFKKLGLVRPKWSDISYAVGGVAVYYLSYVVLLTVVSALVPSLNIDQKQQIGFTDAAGFGSLVMAFLSLVILPPFVEEIMFRGFLYGSLRNTMPKIGAALITSVIFASAHLQVGSNAPLLWVAAIDTFVLSLVLVYLREKTGRLYASMGVHGLKNAIAFVALFIFHAH